MYNQYSPLPFQVEWPTGQVYGGLPDNPPFVPNIVRQGLDPGALTTVTGFLMLCLQNEKDKNPFRMFLFNQMSAGGYNNPDFHKLVDAALDYIDLVAGQGIKIDEVLTKGLNRLCSMIAAYNINQYPALKQYLRTHEEKTDAASLIAEFESVKRDISNMKQRYAGPPQQPNQGYPPQGYNNPGYSPQGYQAQVGQSVPFGTPPGFGNGPAPASPYGAPPPMGNPGGGYYNGPPAYGPTPNYNAPPNPNVPPSFGGPANTGPYSSGGYSPPNAERFANSSVNAGWGRTSEPSNPAPAYDRAPSPQPQPEPVNPFSEIPNAPNRFNSVSSEKKDKPKGKHNTIGFLKLEDGSLLIPARKSTYKPNSNNRYVPAYDPKKEVLYHRVWPNKTVEEVLMNIENVSDDDEYMKQEMNQGFARKVQADRRESQPVDWNKIGTPEHLEEVSDERERRLGMMSMEETDKPMFDGEPIHIVPAITAASFEEARLGATLGYIDMYGELPSNNAIKYAYYRCTPILSKNPDLPMEIKRFCESTDYQTLAERFLLLKDHIETQTWYRLHDRITEHAQECLRMELGTDLRLTSLVDDYGAVFETLEDDFNAAYVDLFQRTASRVAKASGHLLSDKFRDQYVQRLEYPAEKPDIVGDILVFGELNSVIEVPWMASDLKMNLGSQGHGVIMESRYPGLYKTAQTIFSNANKLKNHEFRNHLIVTADNTTLKLYQSVINPDVYLVSK